MLSYMTSQFVSSEYKHILFTNCNTRFHFHFFIISLSKKNEGTFSPTLKHKTQHRPYIFKQCGIPCNICIILYVNPYIICGARHTWLIRCIVCNTGLGRVLDKSTSFQVQVQTLEQITSTSTSTSTSTWLSKVIEYKCNYWVHWLQVLIK